MRAKPRLFEVSEATLAMLARIIGPSSAAAQALAEGRRRQADGESITYFQSGSTILVGPRPTEQSPP